MEDLTLQEIGLVDEFDFELTFKPADQWHFALIDHKPAVAIADDAVIFDEKSDAQLAISLLDFLDSFLEANIEERGNYFAVPHVEGNKVVVEADKVTLKEITVDVDSKKINVDADKINATMRAAFVFSTPDAAAQAMKLCDKYYELDT